MSGLNCYIPQPEYAEIARRLGYRNDNLGKQIISSLVGRYDSYQEDQGKDKLDTKDIDKAVKELRMFRVLERTKHLEKFTKPNKRINRAYDALRHTWNGRERQDRINKVSRMFSAEIDGIVEEAKQRGSFIPRLAVANGFEDEYGFPVGGAFSILESVYNKLESYRANAYNASRDENYEKAYNWFKEKGILSFTGAPKTAEEFKEWKQHAFEEYTKMLENWNSLIPFVLKKIADTEGISIGKAKQYAVKSTEDVFGDSKIAETWNLSESVRDGWMNNSDFISSFGSIGVQVRKAISSVPVMSLQTVEKFNPETGEMETTVQYEPERDDLGNIRYMEPVRVYQYIQSMVRGMQSADHMMQLLTNENGEARVAWMQGLIRELQKNPQLKTQFYVSMRKNFQPYYALKREVKNGIAFIKTNLLNKTKNIIKERYLASMITNGKHPATLKQFGYTYVFNESKNGKPGTVNWLRLNQLRNQVLSYVQEKEQQNSVFGKMYGTSKLLSKDVSYRDKRNFLLETFTSLGFDVEMDTIDHILKSTDIYNVREILEKLFSPKTTPGDTTGFLYALNNDDKKRLLGITKDNADEVSHTIENGTGPKSFKALYDGRKNAGGIDVYPVKENIDKLLDIISTHQDAFRVEQRALYMGNSLFSNVNSNFLGDRLEAIQAYVEQDDKEGLKKFVEEHYLKSPFFVDNEYLLTDGKRGRILNYWLDEIVKACDSKKPLVMTTAKIFSFMRDLGSDSKEFEDFTLKEHAVDMLSYYFSDGIQNKYYGDRSKRDRNMSALYPVFILGDAGVSKYIRAPRITSRHYYQEQQGKLVEITNPQSDREIKRVVFNFDEAAKSKIVDHFYDIYVQETRRMKLDEEMAHIMYGNGKPVKGRDKFSILTFLNKEDQEYKPEYEIKKKAMPNDIKAVIRKYLEQATEDFKKKINDAGVLKTRDIVDKEGNRKQVFSELSNVMNVENVDNQLEDFYWNTKLATAEQLQIVTIDPSFYNGTKDLQKRYKGAHAPGSKLDLWALDRNGERYSKDGIERVVYFDDISLNAELTNPEFMESILRTFAVKDANEVDKAIKEGVLVPKEGAEETARQHKLASLLGDNYKNIYTKYISNTLTDGQGYRTLESYRRVMGMAGKWTEDMENAYEEIKTIRKSHPANEPFTPEEMARVGKLAVVFQPIKPYMFTQEQYEMYQDIPVKDADGKTVFTTDEKGKSIPKTESKKIVSYIPVEHKYAEALIIPELLPQNSKLRDLAEYMDAHNIDVAGSTKICKVGCYGQAYLTHKVDNFGNILDEKGNKVKNPTTGKYINTKDKGWEKYATSLSQNTEGLKEALGRATVHNLSYEDYRIQTNVPVHLDASQLFGTQIRKLIMAGIDFNSNFSDYLNTNEINLGGNNTKAHLNGKTILALYNSLICANIWDSYKTFEGNLTDIDKLAELLQQSTISSDRESMDNVLSFVPVGSEEGNKKFMIPLFEGGLEHDALALILSSFKRAVNKQQISGGSAVQVSAFGIDGYQEDGGLKYVQDPNNKSNIMYAECEIPFDRSYTTTITDKDGNKKKQQVKLNFEQYCYTDNKYFGNVLPSKQEIKKGDTEYKDYMSYTYKEVNGELVPCSADDKDAKVYKPQIEVDYKGILSILAYRIPTERAYSMLNLKIKRFSSPLAGGTLKVPSQGTTIAGFDFDIDKLYFIQREYRRKERQYSESSFDKDDTFSIWNEVYDNNSEIYRRLSNKRDVAEAAAEAEGKPLTKKVTKANGRVRIEHRTTLNSYWDDEMTQQYGDKNRYFNEAAQSLVLAGAVTPNTTVNTKNYGFDEYDFTKTPQENSVTARNNLLIDLMQRRLMDQTTMKQRYTPGGFDGISRAARLMRELTFGNLDNVVKNGSIDFKTLRDRYDDKNAVDPEPNYNPTDPYTILLYNQQNQLAAKLIGIFANQNTNHAFSSAFEKFQLKNPIEFCGHSFKDLIHKDQYGSFLPEADEVDHRMAEFLAASVDAVKDPTLNFLNLNTITADAASLLVRLGYTVEEVGLLFNQPIIKQVCEDAFNYSGNINTAISNMMNSLQNSLIGKDASNVTIDSQSLGKAILDMRKETEEGKTQSDYIKDHVEFQLAVLDLFNKIQGEAAKLSSFVLNTKFTAANAVGSTMGSLYAQQMRVDEFTKTMEDGFDITVSSEGAETGKMSGVIENKEDMLKKDRDEYLNYVRFNPFAYEQLMYDCNRKIIKAMSNYVPYENPIYKSIRNKLSSFARYGNLSEDEINQIHQELPVFLLSRVKNSVFDGEASYIRDGKETNMTNREYYRNEFPKDLMDILNRHPELQSYTIFKYIYPTVETIKEGRQKKDVVSIRMQDVGGLERTAKDEIRDSWAALMDVNDMGEFKDMGFARLAQDLFMYCFYQRGTSFHPISFIHLTPTQVKDYIQVPRPYRAGLNPVDIKTFNTVNPPVGSVGDDVYVYSNENARTAENFGAVYEGEDGENLNTLYNSSFRLREKVTRNDVQNLIAEARSHPELRFKIDKNLTEEELREFSAENFQQSIPDNIYFNSNTIEVLNANGDLKNSLQYGRSRSYRQFLYEILDERETNSLGFNGIDDMVQQFILNHLDDKRFITDVDRSANLREMFSDEKGVVTVSPKVNGERSWPSLEINLNKVLGKEDAAKMSAIAKVNTDKEGNVVGVDWAPCFKWNDNYYMPSRNNGDRFAHSTDEIMRYDRVEPYGTYKRFYYDDGNKRLEPSMMYKSSVEAIDKRGDTNLSDTQNDYDFNQEGKAPVQLEEQAPVTQEEESKADDTVITTSSELPSTEPLKNQQNGTQGQGGIMEILLQKRKEQTDNLMKALKENWEQGFGMKIDDSMFESEGINQKLDNLRKQGKSPMYLKSLVEQVIESTRNQVLMTIDEEGKLKPMC